MDAGLMEFGQGHDGSCPDVPVGPTGTSMVVACVPVVAAPTPGRDASPMRLYAPDGPAAPTHAPWIARAARHVGAGDSPVHDPMLVRLVQMQMREDALDAFLGLFARTADRIRAAPGCRRLDLWQDTDDPTRVATHSHWDDAAALDAYRQSDLFRATWAETKTYFAARASAQSFTRTWPGEAESGDVAPGDVAPGGAMF